MTMLSDIFPIADLESEIAEGYVRIQYHPTDTLAILNYTEKAVYSKHWNNVTSNCRGLIFDKVSFVVEARPFSKFFNYGELPPGSIDLNAHVEVTDKMDGSLGILYVENTPEGTELAIATRGSFASDQAIHATRLLRKKYPDFEPIEDFTYLFEIIYRSNRIVLDYGDQDDLVLIGAVNIRTGKAVGPYGWTLGWGGPVTQVLGEMTFAQALAIPPRQNAEGIVIHVFETDQKVKIKQDDYVALHRIVTGMNERAVWQRMIDGDNLDQIKTGLPEEFWSWVDTTYNKILDGVIHVIHVICDVYDSCWAALGFLDGVNVGRPDRKEFALKVKDSPLKGYLFMLLDGKDIYPAVLRAAKPDAGGYMTQAVESE
jgi:RNA ligase